MQELYDAYLNKNQKKTIKHSTLDIFKKDYVAEKQQSKYAQFLAFRDDTVEPFLAKNKPLKAKMAIIQFLAD